MAKPAMREPGIIMTTYLEIRQERKRTSLACRVELDERTLAWLIELAEIRGITPAQVARDTLGLVAADDVAAHEVLPATLQ
jgi:hypothetical protein